MSTFAPVYTINNSNSHTYYCCIHTQNKWLQLPAKAQVVLYGREGENKILFSPSPFSAKNRVYVLPSYSCTIELGANRIYATGDIRDVTTIENEKPSMENALLAVHNHTSKNVTLVHHRKESIIAPGLWEGKVQGATSISSVTIPPALFYGRLVLHVRNTVTYEKDLHYEQITINGSIFAFITLIGIIILLIFLYNNYAPR